VFSLPRRSIGAMTRWRAFLRGAATLNLWGTPAERLPVPPIGDVLADDAAKVHADFTRAFGRPTRPRNRHLTRQSLRSRVV
jgi:hypothetical protein